MILFREKIFRDIDMLCRLKSTIQARAVTAGTAQHSSASHLVLIFFPQFGVTWWGKTSSSSWKRPLWSVKRIFWELSWHKVKKKEFKWSLLDGCQLRCFCCWLRHSTVKLLLADLRSNHPFALDCDTYRRLLLYEWKAVVMKTTTLKALPSRERLL